MKDNETQIVSQLYIWSFILRFGAGLLAWFLTSAMDMSFVQDALYYEEVGAQIAEDWWQGRPSPWLNEEREAGKRPWVIVVTIAVFYYMLGGVRALPILLALWCACTAWTPVLTFRIAQRLGATPAACRAAAWLVVLSPCFAFWSGALYKEGLILLLLNLCIYHTLVLQESWQWDSLIYICVGLSLLYGLRFYLAILMALVLCLGLLLGRAKGIGAPSLLLRQGLLLTFFILALVAAGFTSQAQKSLPDSLEQGFGRLQNSRDDLASYSSGYMRDAKVSNLGDAIRTLPTGLLYFLTVPWPWQLGSMRQNLVIPENLVWLLMYPLIFLGMKDALRKNFQGAVLLILLTLAICCFYALFSANVGMAYRMRTQVWVVWAIFAGWGWDAVRRPVETTEARPPVEAVAG